LNLQEIESLIDQIVLEAYPDHRLVTVCSLPEDPMYVWKVFASDRLHKLENEYRVYQQIGQSPYFSTCYGKGERYLILSYEEGPTLYECLEQGIEVPYQAIADVEAARAYIREIGLNPRDIHLRNIVLQNGRAKLFDVSEYIHPGNDGRWDHLVQAYEQFYPLIRGKKIPSWLIDVVKKAYAGWKETSNQSIIDFGKRYIQKFGLMRSEEPTGKEER
jgi:hypothetical protein